MIKEEENKILKIQKERDKVLVQVNIILREEENVNYLGGEKTQMYGIKVKLMSLNSRVKMLTFMVLLAKQIYMKQKEK